MKNYVIGFQSVCILVLLVLLYKGAITPILVNFPLNEIKQEKNESGEPPLFLFVYFSRHNCNTCLEIVRVLNELSSPFIVTGIVPEEELNDERSFRNITGAAFPLISKKRFNRKFNPIYKPTIYGVSGKGTIFFVLPGVPYEKEYFKDFLLSLYTKILDYLIMESNNGSYKPI